MAVTYSQIATQTLGSATATVTFSSISGSYTDLILIVNGSTTIDENYRIRFNSDTGSNYSYTRITGDGTSAASERATNAAFIQFTAGDHTKRGAFIVNIQNYSNTTTNKTTLSRHSIGESNVGAYVGLWRNTSAITSITLTTFSTTFTSGSTFSLYGILAA